MITCPNCSHHEMEGGIFCSECGTQLRYLGASQKSIVNPPVVEEALQVKRIKGRGAAHRNPYPETIITLYIPAIDIFIPIKGEEVIIGRSGEGQSMIPDVDLNKFQALETGVSRFHASIHVDEVQATITDLGSANGTRINDVKIQPHVSHPLRDGDNVSLGKFTFEVILRKNSW